MTPEDAFPPLTVARKIWSVRDLTEQVREAIEGFFPDVWVEGEISGLRVAGSGHCYFTLKDATAQIRAVLFRAGGRFLRFILKEGQAVRVRGHLTLYVPRGEYQLVVDYVEPAGRGALHAAFEALKEKLRGEGLLDAERKVPIPLFPRTVMLITASSGAVVHDMLTVMRSLPMRIQITPVPVQGEEAAPAISRALDRADQSDADLIILARGGGSLEDLWAFNEEAVARAIARCRTPVISAVGHETDVTLADFVADLRAPTPSLAAEMVARGVRGVLERFALAQIALQTQMRRQVAVRRDRLQSMARRLVYPRQRLARQRDRAAYITLRMTALMQHRLVLERERWRRGAQGLIHLHPGNRLKWAWERLRHIQAQLHARAGETLRQRRTHLLQCVAQMDALSPLAVLGRGYSLTRRLSDQAIVRSADQVASGDRVTVHFHKGAAVCVVQESQRQSS